MRRLCDGGGRTKTYYHNGGNNTTAVKNPFTYRGYYYDKDLEFYYLNSRYYDPFTCRFISADSYVSTGQGFIGHNMYAYCGNNPVNRIDPTGRNWVHGILFWAVERIIGLGMVIIQANNPTEKETYSIPEDIHMYESGKGAPVEGKINVRFSPNNTTKGRSNPSFQIENSYLITSRAEQEKILMYIMESEYYDQNLYGRTLDSMVREWQLHNAFYADTKDERYQHTDFDRMSESDSYSEFLFISGFYVRYMIVEKY